MRKRLFISAVSLLLTVVCYAQWSVQDSLKLQKLLESSEELKLNPEALPKPKVVLSLMPYKANTRFNWDPVYQKKIRVDKNTWRGDPFYEIRQQRSYTNWARNPMAKGIRKSLEEIQASGVRFRQLSERANGMMVNSVVTDSPIPLFGGSGVYINGGTIGGLDLMAVFTKNFWDKKGRDRRERTLEVLRAYGDSTTVLINKPIEQIIR